MTVQATLLHGTTPWVAPFTAPLERIATSPTTTVSADLSEEATDLALDPLRLCEEYVVTGARQFDEHSVPQFRSEAIAVGLLPRLRGGADGLA